MLHTTKSIELFLYDVNKQAEEAAQLIFDKHQKEWEKLIERTKLKGVELIQGNGTATYRTKSNYNSNSPMSKRRDVYLEAISRAQYSTQRAGFETKAIK